MRQRIGGGDYAGARRDLDALEAAAEAADPLADLEAADTPAKLRAVLDALDPVEPPSLADLAVTLDLTGDPPTGPGMAGGSGRGWLAPCGTAGNAHRRRGEGKSRLALQLAVAIATDPGAGAEAGRLLPSDRRGEDAADDVGPVVRTTGTVAVVGWEDEDDEARRRLRWLREAQIEAAGATGDRLRYLDAASAGIGALWGPETDGSGHNFGARRAPACHAGAGRGNPFSRRWRRRPRNMGQRTYSPTELARHGGSLPCDAGAR